jgi:phosphatidylethanolamine/phosphatidyl-N-methylethanolamine N-methyltransferase
LKHAKYAQSRQLLKYTIFEWARECYLLFVMNVKKRSFQALDDQLRFLLTWVGNPLKTGAVTPSGKALASAMAAEVDPAIPGPVVELGPGTGPVTEALIARGIDASRIIALEYDSEFADRLQKRFPGIMVIHGDAYDLSAKVTALMSEKACAVISSLPLFTESAEKRITLLNTAFELMQDNAPFVQFSYAPLSPIPRERLNVRSSVSDWILLNVPPARVWTYRKGPA